MKRRGKFRTAFRRGGKLMYAIRNSDGTFTNIQSIKRTMRAERRRAAKTTVRPQYGFRGDTRKKKR